MPDVRTMTLDEVLSADPSVLNAAVEWAVFCRYLLTVCPECGHESRFPVYRKGQSASDRHVGCGSCGTYYELPRDFLGDWNLTWLVVERLKELTVETSRQAYPYHLPDEQHEPWITFIRSLPGIVPASKIHKLSRRGILEAAIRALWPREKGGE